MELSDLQKVALAAATPKSKVDAIKKALEQSSEAEVDFLVRLKGKVTKGANVVKRNPAALPQIDMLIDSLDIMAELVSGMNAEMADAFLDRLANRENRAIDLDRKRSVEGKVVESFIKRFLNGNRQEMDAERKASFQSAWDTVAETTVKETNGSVKFKGIVEAVEATGDLGE